MFEVSTMPNKRSRLKEGRLINIEIRCDLLSLGKLLGFPLPFYALVQHNTQKNKVKVSKKRI